MELLRVDLREKYRSSYFLDWEGRDLTAQHRFVPAENHSTLRMSFTVPGRQCTQAGLVLDSEDGGETWLPYQGPLRHPPCNLGMFQLGQQGQHRLALYGSTVCWISNDGGFTWRRRSVPGADELHFDGLGAPNCFSATMVMSGIHAGRIVMVADYFLDQEGPDGQLLCSVYTDDLGESWSASRLFGPPDPLPKAPEGFGEPAVVELPSGWLWMVFRSPYGELWQCISRDSGTSWSRPTPTGLSSPIANCYAARDPYSGVTVLCWNAARPGLSEDFESLHSLYRPRTNLVFAVSRDNTRTWSCPHTVEPMGGFYPTIGFTRERMVIMYQSTPTPKPVPWHECGLTFVAYDRREIAKFPSWTTETIQPFIDQRLVAGWRILACRPPSRDTIT